MKQHKADSFRHPPCTYEPRFTICPFERQQKGLWDLSGWNVYIQKEIHQLRPALDSCFGVNVFHMGFYGVFAHMKLTGNHPIGFAFDKKGCDFTLALGEFFCDTELTDQLGLFLSWHFSNCGQKDMVFEQGGQPCV